jgi:hypothetical protein
MNKKEYVLRMLDTLQNTWPLAKGLKVLVNANPLDTTIVDLLITTFKETIKTLDDEKQQESLKKATSFLEKLKEKEHESTEQDQKDINELEGMLSSI